MAFSNPFAGAVLITGESGTNTGNNNTATGEFGEPLASAGGGAGDGSVWAKWVPPERMGVEFDTVGSNFDTILSVWVGATLASLVEVTSNDDGDGEDDDTASRVSFCAIEGVTYYLKITGYDDERGSIVMSWAPKAVGATEVCTGFVFTGAESDELVIPAGVTEVQMVAQGGGAWNGDGGLEGRGAVVEATVAASEGDVFTVKVGERGNSFGSGVKALGGWPDGGDSGEPGHDSAPCFAGGGSTTILKNGAPVVIAGAAGWFNGGTPSADVGPRDCDGDGGTTTAAGGGGEADAVMSNIAGEAGDTDGAGQGGDGADGIGSYEYAHEPWGPVTQTGATSHTVSGRQVYDSGPVTIVGPLAVPPYARISLHITDHAPDPSPGADFVTGNFAVGGIILEDSADLMGNQAAALVGGDVEIGEHYNDSEEFEFVEVYIYVVGTSAADTGFVRVITEDESPGGGAGGGFKGGGGGASRIDPGDDSIDNGHGGGGSSWVTPSATGVSYSLASAADLDGLAEICYSLVCEGCEACPFEYPYRWPAFGVALLAGQQLDNILAILSVRDRGLCSRLADCGEDFEYPYPWETIFPAFIDPTRHREAAALLEENDRALELHMLFRSCSVPFEYPHRWADLVGWLFDPDSDRQKHTISLLENRDRMLEDALSGTHA